jgi:hypothetical protein
MTAMLVAGLTVEDRLAGASNWSPWKARIVLILEGELLDIVENPVVPPTDAVLMAEFRMRNIRAKRTILDAVKDHVIPYVVKSLHFRCGSHYAVFTRVLTRTRRWCSRRS